MKNLVGLLLILLIGFLGTGHAQNVDFDEFPVAYSISGNAGVFVADIDGDSLKDIVGTAANSNKLYWWKNSGDLQDAWEEHIVNENLNVLYVYAADVDGDEKVDILATSSTGSHVTWWKNCLGEETPWPMQTIREGFINAHGIFSADINNDGYMDVVASAAGDGLICWWENDGEYPITWTEHLVDSLAAASQSLTCVDLDGDTDIDIVATIQNKVVWYQNSGQDSVSWNRYTIDNFCNFSHWVDVGDMNNDGLLDVVATGFYENHIMWYEKDGEDPADWIEHAVEGNLAGGLTVRIADMNNDSLLDIVGKALGNNQIMWFEQTDVEDEWESHVIRNITYPWALYLADLDDDNDMDVVTGSYSLGVVKGFENEYCLASINEPPSILDKNFLINYPNPFNPETTIAFNLSQAAKVDLTVYNVKGQKIKTLVSEMQPAGGHSLIWDGSNADGTQVASGLYLYQLQVDGETQAVKKMMLMK